VFELPRVKLSEIQGKSILVLVSARLIRVSEGSSYSTVKEKKNVHDKFSKLTYIILPSPKFYDQKLSPILMMF